MTDDNQAAHREGFKDGMLAMTLALVGDPEISLYMAQARAWEAYTARTVSTAAYKDVAGLVAIVVGRREDGLVRALRKRGGKLVEIQNVDRLRVLTTRHLAIPAPGDPRSFSAQLEAASSLELAMPDTDPDLGG